VHQRRRQLRCPVRRRVVDHQDVGVGAVLADAREQRLQVLALVVGGDDDEESVAARGASGNLL
jgi:hypothetical protein